MDAYNVNVPPESSGELRLPTFPCLSPPCAGGRGWDPPTGPSPTLPLLASAIHSHLDGQPLARKSHLEPRTRLNVPQEGSS